MRILNLMIHSGLLRMRSPSLEPTDLGKVSPTFRPPENPRPDFGLPFLDCPVRSSLPLAPNILPFLDSMEVDLHFLNNDFQQQNSRAMYNAFSPCQYRGVRHTSRDFASCLSRTRCDPNCRHHVIVDLLTYFRVSSWRSPC